MNRFYLSLILAALLLFGNTAYTQPAVYGLHFARTGTSVPVTGFQRFVQVDLLTGSYTVLDTISAVRGVVVGSSTFDHSSHRYIFWGMDSLNAKRLYSLDALTGSLLANPPLSNNPVELQYDLQNGILYGLSWDHNTQTLRMVTVNLQNGAVSVIGTLNGVRAVVVSGTAFNSNNGTYYLYGTDFTQVRRLYRINASTGQVLSSVPFSPLVSEFQYDVTYNKLYGLFRPANNQPVQLVSIDTLTGGLTQVTSFPNLTGLGYGIPVGASTYDQTTGTYLFRDHNGGDSLYAVAVQSGAVLASPLSDNVIELEADNTTFAARRYQPQPAPGPVIQENLFQVVANPNPMRNYLEVEVVSPLDLNGQVSLTDLSGQELFNRPLLTQKTPGYFAFDVSSLLPGLYLLRVNTQVGAKVLKIVRQ